MLKENMMSYNFIGEKKFNRLECFNYNLHGFKKDTEISNKRQHGGRSVIIWAALEYNEQPKIHF